MTRMRWFFRKLWLHLKVRWYFRGCQLESVRIDFPESTDACPHITVGFDKAQKERRP